MTFSLALDDAKDQKMKKYPQPIPEGYATLTLNYLVDDVPRFIAFITQAFDARESHRVLTPGGQYVHAEFMIRDTLVMLSGADDTELPICNSVYMYVPDVDLTFQQALSAGARMVWDVEDTFYGDRVGRVVDPFGNIWTIATHTGDVPAQDFQRGLEALD